MKLLGQLALSIRDGDVGILTVNGYLVLRPARNSVICGCAVHLPFAVARYTCEEPWPLVAYGFIVDQFQVAIRIKALAGSSK